VVVYVAVYERDKYVCCMECRNCKAFHSFFTGCAIEMLAGVASLDTKVCGLRYPVIHRLTFTQTGTQVVLLPTSKQHYFLLVSLRFHWSL